MDLERVAVTPGIPSPVNLGAGRLRFELPKSMN
jgi:hypothetical protein